MFVYQNMVTQNIETAKLSRLIELNAFERVSLKKTPPHTHTCWKPFYNFCNLGIKRLLCILLYHFNLKL